MLPLAVMRKVPLALLLLMLVACTDARILPNRSKQVKVYSYVLPAGAEEIRDDINHSFACANRSDGFYVDIDNDCQIFHRCQDRARFSFICAERTVFSQMYQTCVHDGQLGYPCEDSAQYYPEGEGSAAPSEASRPAQEGAPEEKDEQPAAMAPSKSSELVMGSVDTGSIEMEAMNEVEPSQDNTQLASEQTAPVKVEQVNDVEEHHHGSSQHQVNADLFDSVEDESDVPSENSAQEVLDEVEPAASPSAIATEVASADVTTQEDSQEVEVMDDFTQSQDEQVPEVIPQVVESLDDEEVLDASAPVQTVSEGLETVASTPVDLFTHTVHGDESHYAGDSLLNAVQTVEELEPIVHDLFVEHADLSVPQSQLGEMSHDSAPAKVDTMEEDGNEVLPESDTVGADMESLPLANTPADDESPSDDEVSEGAETLPASALESDQQVNELLPEQEVGLVAEAVDDSSETIVIGAVDGTESDKPEQLASEPEAGDVRPESIGDDEGEELNSSVVVEPSRPLESPAIVEEMAPLRPNDSVDLPELIVSTEFHLATATQGPAIRRRKTFLFRADAVRSRH